MSPLALLSWTISWILCIACRERGRWASWWKTVEGWIMGNLWTGSAKVLMCLSPYFLMFGFCSASLSVLHISALCCVTGIVGDVVLNHAPLRGFTTFCLDMKPDFMKRSANPVSFYVIRTFWELFKDILWFIIEGQFHTRKLNLLFHSLLYFYLLLFIILIISQYSQTKI